MNERVAIRVDSPDPVAEIGVLTQLGSRPEVVIAGAQGQPAVAVLPLAGPGELTTALADDAVTLRRLLGSSYREPSRVGTIS